MPVRVSTDSPRVVFFSNDPSGLGHLRRTLKIAWYLHGRWPGSRQLIVTGSPGIQILPIPDGAELLKLPSITSSGFRKHSSRYLPMSFPEIRELRRDLLLDLGRHYQPDLALIDHLPAGPGGDLVPCLREMKARSPRTRLVLGLRDVTYEPGLLRKAWDAEGVYALLDEVYEALIAQLRSEQAKGLGLASDFVFTSETGRPLGRERISKRGVTAAAKRAGLGHVTAQDLRRSVATATAHAGLPVVVAAAMTGHSPRVYDEHYAKPFRDADERARVRDSLASIGFGSRSVDQSVDQSPIS